MGIHPYIFLSIHNAEKHSELPLMHKKICRCEDLPLRGVCGDQDLTSAALGGQTMDNVLLTTHLYA